MRAFGWILVAALGLAGFLTLDPALIGLSEITPVLQAIAMRGLLAGVALGLGVLLGLAGLITAYATRGGGRRLLVLGLIAVVVGTGHGGVLAERGIGTGAPFGPKPDGAIDVLTLNTLGTTGGIEELVATIDDLRPDAVALQETPPDDAERIADALAHDYQVFTHTTGPNPVQGTALLVAAELGEYEQTDAPATTFGGVWARPLDGGPELLSVHPVPPVPSNVQTWRAELAALTGLCDRVDGVVLAGDLNATVDHVSLRASACIPSAVGVGGHGTWPADRSAWLSTPIDHVLADPRAWQPIGARVLTVGGGDHHAVLVRLVPAG